MSSVTLSTDSADSDLRRYRLWFYAAAVYNLVWGGGMILWPNFFFDVLGMSRPNYPALWQVTGMFVLVYAPAYWWAARYPYRHRHLILIALLGKVLGPIGFLWSVSTGQLPLAFGWTILTNDLIWWPVLGLYLQDVAKACGGWAKLLLGG